MDTEKPGSRHGRVMVATVKTRPIVGARADLGGRARSNNASVKGIQSIELGGSVLSALADGGGPMPLRDVGLQSGMPSSQARRYLLSFIRIGLVEQNEDTGHYTLGPLTLRLGLSALANLSIDREAPAFLAQLRLETKETVVLAIWTERGATILRIEESRRPVMLNLRVGSTFPMLTSATGLIFAAFLKTDAVTNLIDAELREAKLRELPITAASYQRKLADVRKAELSRADASLLPGVSAVGAPIFDHLGALAGAMMVVGHHGLMDTSATGSVAVALRATTRALSERLGFKTA